MGGGEGIGLGISGKAAPWKLFGNNGFLGGTGGSKEAIVVDVRKP